MTWQFRTRYRNLPADECRPTADIAVLIASIPSMATVFVWYPKTKVLGQEVAFGTRQLEFVPPWFLGFVAGQWRRTHWR